jgi:hemerythrin-like domain-containing protein
MEVTETFRVQHNELLVIAKEIAANLKADVLRKDASAVRFQLSQLAGVLTVHLSAEDRWLYPKLSAHPDAAEIAKRYVDEMGGLKEAFGAYMKRWNTSTDIQANPEAFVKDTQGIFEALSNRIDRENRELYPLADRIGLAGLAS